jgi:hypothetical protein
MDCWQVLITPSRYLMPLVLTQKTADLATYKPKEEINADVSTNH